jgi:hypothetical protein
MKQDTNQATQKTGAAALWLGTGHTAAPSWLWLTTTQSRGAAESVGSTTLSSSGFKLSRASEHLPGPCWPP